MKKALLAEETAGDGERASRPAGTADGPRFASMANAVSKETLAALPFERATPVQAATIPLLLGNKDVCVSAETGSGKTLAFAIPAAELAVRTTSKNHVAVLVLSPTRELAAQTAKVLTPLLEAHNIELAMLTGGTPVATDAATLAANAPPRVVVGTPGRVADAVQRAADGGDNVLRRVELLVLDEADRLLDLGFQRHVDAILSKCNKQRRTGLFSATQTEAVSALARSGMRNPTRVALARTTGNTSNASETAAPSLATPQSLTMQYAVVPHVGKWPLLCSYVRAHANDKVLVYVLTCASVRYYAAAIKAIRAGSAGPAGARCFPSHTTFRWMHGKMPQSQRQRALAEFESAPSGAVLLCTDVAARGLDFKGGVDRVVQLDVPKDVDTFVHRCGRCGRMGREGTALSFLAPHEVSRGFLDVVMARGVAPPSPAGGAGASFRIAGVGDDMAASDAAALASGWERFHAFSTVRPSDVRLRGGKPPAGKPPEAPPPIPYAEEAASAWRKCGGAAPDVLGTLRALSASDRALMELGVEAFVAQVKGYKEHSLQFVLRWKDLDVGGLATAFGCLRAPAMPEVSLAVKWAKWWRATTDGEDAALPGLVEAAIADVDAVPYKDDAKEAARQAALAAKRAAPKAVSKASTDARGKKNAPSSAAEPAPAKRETGEKRYKRELRRDLAELDEDYRLLKRMRKAGGAPAERAFASRIGL